MLTLSAPAASIFISFAPGKKSKKSPSSVRRCIAFSPFIVAVKSQVFISISCPGLNTNPLISIYSSPNRDPIPSDSKVISEFRSSIKIIEVAFADASKLISNSAVSLNFISNIEVADAS